MLVELNYSTDLSNESRMTDRDSNALQHARSFRYFSSLPRREPEKQFHFRNNQLPGATRLARKLLGLCGHDRCVGPGKIAMFAPTVKIISPPVVDKAPVSKGRQNQRSLRLLA
jgi:hypothetical protein